MGTFQAHWAIKSEGAATRAERARLLEAERKEMDLMNLELLARRTARLKHLYQKLTDRYENEPTKQVSGVEYPIEGVRGCPPGEPVYSKSAQLWAVECLASPCSSPHAKLVDMMKRAAILGDSAMRIARHMLSRWCFIEIGFLSGTGTRRN